MSSKRPYPAEAWPEERAAANPPRVAYSTTGGSAPGVSPCPLSSSSACGPRSPAGARPPWTPRRPTPACRAAAGPGRRPRRKPSRSAATPPTTDAAAAEGHHRDPLGGADAQQPGDLVVGSGQHDGVRGRPSRLPMRIFSRSGVDLPLVWRIRASASVRTRSAPTMDRNESSTKGDSSAAGSRTSPKPAGSPVGGVTPSDSASSSRRRRGRGRSPCRDHPSPTRERAARGSRSLPQDAALSLQVTQG